MPDATTGWAPHISQQLRAAKKSLQDVIADPKSDPNVMKCLIEAEAEILERDISEITTLLRSWKNGFAPINRLPPEILTTIPHFSDGRRRHRVTIALTHVCRAWREIFISRPSLWTDLCWKGAEKARTYIERSKSSPVNVTLSLNGKLSPHHIFFQVIPRTTGRLKSLTMHGPSEYPKDVADHLSNPEPLLECLEMNKFTTPISGLFAGDLSSLRNLRLSHLNIELSWRNMTNLTSVRLHTISPPIPVAQLLDCFEGAPLLRTIRLTDAISTSDTQDDRLISLASLKTMKINGRAPCAPLFDHLSIPVGTKLDIISKSFDPSYENIFPGSPGNLKNLVNFTTVGFQFKTGLSSARFSGPNGDLLMTSELPEADISTALEYLDRLDSSATEQLVIVGGGSLPADVVHRVLRSMQDLRTLKIHKGEHQYTFIDSLTPQPQPSSVVVCPRLEGLSLTPCRNEEKSAIQSMIRMAASRASRGAKLETIKIMRARGKFDLEDVLELEEHVLRMEFDGDVASNG
ncbi:hypothetical protein BJ322DRAFT_1041462 [Thelephora terrestris]|uniref:F-box domain-containing protein n=1 Tax=Thelephora terrestris TaxID=56493 RepID=A0A9P6LA83_9AGAM|nr:hypothetical protein BJ322DRAFT_1041462 [Thelephora terrestris]